VPSTSNDSGLLVRVLWHPKATVLVVLVALLFVGGNYLHNYSVATRVFIPQESNSALIMHPSGEAWTIFGRSNETLQYRFFLDSNATLYFGVFEVDSSSRTRVGSCDFQGHPIFQRETAELNETLSIGPGDYGYVLCNQGSSIAFGNFQYSVLKTIVAQPRYNVGSLMQITAGLVAAWGLSLVPEGLHPRSKTVRYSRFLRWTLAAPVILLFASICFAGAVSANINTDVLPLVLASVLLIATHPEMLFVTLRAVMLLLCFVVLLLTANVSLAAYAFRVRAKTGHVTGPSRHRLPRILLSQLDLLSQRCANLVLPDNPHVGVFVRLGIVSLFIAEVITISPWEFVRTLNPYLNLPPWVLPMDASTAELGLESLMLPMIMTIFGLFAYSLTWKPRWPRAFRAIGTIYVTLFSLSLLLVVNHLMSQDYLIDLVTRFVAILPLTLASAYLAWITEISTRHIINWAKKAPWINRDFPLFGKRMEPIPSFVRAS